MLAAMQAEMGNLRQTSQRAQGEAAQSKKLLSKLQSALSDDDGKGGKEPEPAWFDDVLGEILEARQQGVNLPITSKLAVELHKSQQEQARLIAMVEQLKGGVDVLQNPDYAVDTRAYDNMDSMIGESLRHVWGGEYPPGMGKAVTSSLVNWLKELRTEAPEKWTEVRRDTNMQRKIVQHYVNQHIPAHLREMQKNIVENAKPFTHQDALEAYQEAQTLPPEQRAKVMPIVRQKIWETMYSKQNPRQR
jgi:hypothetical protein